VEKCVCERHTRAFLQQTSDARLAFRVSERVALRIKDSKDPMDLALAGEWIMPPKIRDGVGRHARQIGQRNCGRKTRREPCFRPAKPTQNGLIAFKGKVDDINSAIPWTGRH